jgi:hypothetical protein
MGSMNMSKIIKTKDQQAESIAAVIEIAKDVLSGGHVDALINTMAIICTDSDIDYVLVEEYQKLMVNGNNNDK